MELTKGITKLTIDLRGGIDPRKFLVVNPDRNRESYWVRDRTELSRVIRNRTTPTHLLD